jgi:CarboxypepD_reg-like domain
MNRRVLLTLICFLLVFAAQAQKTIRGFVIDSASFIPLSYVSVSVKNTFRGMSTDSKGAFSVNTVRGDTVVFSLVGYNELVFSAAELEETVIIRLAEKIKVLQGVTIIGHKEKTVPALHLKPKSNLPNYGPYGAGINLGYFSKIEKEKRKLVKVKLEQQRVKSYVMVVCSPDVREKICKEFSLTEDQYYQMLAEFNIENQNVNRVYSSEEWITLLRDYYADILNRK